MTIAHAIPELWSARILEKFPRISVYRPMVTDVSSELTVGDTLHLNEITTAVTIRDYSRNTDIADPQILDDADQTMTIDQLKYFNIYVDDVDRVQTRPALLDHFSLLAAREMVKTIDNYLKGQIWPGSLAGTRKESAANLTGVSTDAKILEFIDKILEIKVKLESGDNPWPPGAYMVLAPDIAGFIIKWLVHQGQFGTGDINNRALTEGALTQLFGFRTRVDPNLSQTAATGRTLAGFAHTEATFWIEQLRQVIPYRPEKRFGDAIKGLAVYTAKLVQDSKVYLLQQT